jgi:hypothetical protein
MAKNYPHSIQRLEINGHVVEMVNEGPSFGVIQLFVYLDGKQFGASHSDRVKADQVFREAMAEAGGK